MSAEETYARAAAARDWVKILARYREPNHTRSVFELVLTGGCFVAFWVLTWAALWLGYWLALLVAVPAAGFLVRLFMIQHDCGHGSFFRQRAANDWVGRVIGVLTLTPYDAGGATHAIHHATSGNLERRGIGDITTLTVEEYLALSRWRRLGYRLYRNPFVMFGLGPAYLFMLQHRLPLERASPGWACLDQHDGDQRGHRHRHRGDDVGRSASSRSSSCTCRSPAGVRRSASGCSTSSTSSRRPTGRGPPNWSQHEAALHGSSHYDLPRLLRWFTANIGVHHVHHLSSRIPYYRLPRVLRDYPELKGVGRLTLLQSLACVPLVLWDEGRQRLISFRDLRRSHLPATKR